MRQEINIEFWCKLFVRSRRIYEDNIKMHLVETVCGTGMWLEVTQDSPQLQALDSVVFYYQKAEFHICSSAFNPHCVSSTLWSLFIILRFWSPSTSFLFLCTFLLIRSYLHCFSVPLFSSNFLFLQLLSCITSFPTNSPFVSLCLLTSQWFSLVP
jgi:hypothetical protein